MSLINRFIASLVIFLACSASAIAVADQATVKPALWKIQHQGTTSYLFGSIHIGSQSWYPLPKHINQAYEQSSVLAVELNTLAHGLAVQAAMSLPAGQSLQQKISSETFAKLADFSSQYGIPVDTFNGMKPWAAATVAAVLPYMKQGLLPQFGIDMHFINAAGIANKPIVEFETVEFQLGMLEQVFSDEAAFVEVLDTPSVAAIDMVKHWLAGDMKEIAQLTNEQMTPQQLELILIKRNHDWLAKLKAILANNKSHFVVVGAAHLAGRHGLPALLKAQGVNVERVKGF